MRFDLFMRFWGVFRRLVLEERYRVVEKQREYWRLGEDGEII